MKILYVVMLITASTMIGLNASVGSGKGVAWGVVAFISALVFAWSIETRRTPCPSCGGINGEHDVDCVR